MSLSQAMLQEFKVESEATKKLLERLPDGDLSFTPHEKSMSLGRLATHVAELPQWAQTIVNQEELDFAQGAYTPPKGDTRDEILEVFRKNAAVFENALEGKTDDVLLRHWRLKNGDQVLIDVPRIAALRSFIFGHLIHHRGQLTVYLRLKNIPLPAIYGPTADESPF